MTRPFVNQHLLHHSAMDIDVTITEEPIVMDIITDAHEVLLELDNSKCFDHFRDVCEADNICSAQPPASLPPPEEPPRASTPVFRPEGKRQPRNFDPFEPDFEEVPPQQEEYTAWGHYDLSGPPPPPPPGPPPYPYRKYSATYHANGNSASPTNGHSQFSPTKAYADRKRKYTNPDDDGNHEARRQDDYTPKRKSAPRVADAYR